MTRAPWSTPYVIPLASSRSVSDPSSRTALITSSCASPPNPATPSPFATDPAASDETNVPCPLTSRTSEPAVARLYVHGDFAARSGAVRSAPVSTTAIFTKIQPSEAASRAEILERLRAPAAACARINGECVNLSIPWNDSFSGKLSNCPRDGHIKLKRLPMRSRPQGSLAAVFLPSPP